MKLLIILLLKTTISIGETKGENEGSSPFIRERNAINLGSTSQSLNLDSLEIGSGRSCDLQRLAAVGDCTFYQCAESLLQCQLRGHYTLSSFGGQFCNSFGRAKDQFTPRGVSWVENTMKCLTMWLMNHLRSVAKSCASIHEVALQAHQDCFLQSPPGLCSVLMEERNVRELAGVYAETGATEHDRLFLLRQIEELAASCIDRHLNLVVTSEDGPDRIREAKRDMTEAVTTFRNILPQPSDQPLPPVNATEASCVQLANNGDCAFYECFHKRFPCQQSHLKEFEAISCQRLKDSTNSTEGKIMVRNYQQCLMGHLLPLYRAANIRCSLLDREAHFRRRTCLQDAGLCHVPKVDWLIEGGTELGGFPVKMPVWYNIPSQPGRGFTLVQPYYFRHTSLLKGQFADIQCRCRANTNGLCQPKYSYTYTDDTRQIVEASRGTQRSDADCRHAGGTCQEDRRACNGTYAGGLCSGSTSWHCCLPNGNDWQCIQAGARCELTKYSHTCDEENGVFLPTLCAGNSNRQCCVPNTKGRQCSVARYSNTNYKGRTIYTGNGFRASLDKLNAFAQECHVEVHVTHGWRRLDQRLEGAVDHRSNMSNHDIGHAIDFTLLVLNGTDSWPCNGSCMMDMYREGDNQVHCLLDKVLRDSVLDWGGRWRDPQPTHVDDRHNVRHTDTYFRFLAQTQAACWNEVP